MDTRTYTLTQLAIAVGHALAARGTDPTSIVVDLVRLRTYRGSGADYHAVADGHKAGPEWRYRSRERYVERHGRPLTLGEAAAWLADHIQAAALVSEMPDPEAMITK